MTFDPPAAAPGAPAPDPQGAPWRFRFLGNGGELFGITLINVVLGVLTLGVWFAWGRIRELRFLVGATTVDGDPMSFHGRGGELFRGVLIAFLVFIVPVYVLFFIAAQGNAAISVFALLFAYLLLFALVGFAAVGSLRYRLPRTEWRGIRFGFEGRAMEFMRAYLPRALLVAVSLGLAYPAYACWRRNWIMARSRFGTERFACEAEAGPLFRTFIPMYLLGFVTFGMTWLYYVGHQQGYLWNRSRLGAARFSSTMTGGNWFGLQIGNLLLALVTLGFAAPWIVVRTHRFFMEHLGIEGTLDLAAIRQQLQRTGGVGEGLLDVLDVDSGLDLG